MKTGIIIEALENGYIAIGRETKKKKVAICAKDVANAISDDLVGIIQEMQQGEVKVIEFEIV